MSVEYNQRTLCVGMTESGKSELLNVQLSAMRCQRALVDTKDEFAIEGVPAARTAGDVDWRQPVVHYIPDPSDLADVEQFFTDAFRRRHLVVCVHELADLCEYRAQAAPAAVRRYWRQGARHGLGALAGSQRTVELPSSARTEANHIFYFVPELDQRDHQAVAAAMRMGPDELARELEQLQAAYGPYSFLWFNRQTRELKHCKPLPTHVRRRNLVARTTVA